MNRHTLLFITLPLFVIAVALLLVGGIFAYQRSQSEQRQATVNDQAKKVAEGAASSGFDFFVQGRAVEAVLTPASTEIQRGDSLSITLRLKPGSFNNTSGLGDERDGVLTPTLSVGDCSVTPAQAGSKSTKELRTAAFSLSASTIHFLGTQPSRCSASLPPY